MKTLWDLLKELADKRWVRYLVAGLFPLIGVLLGAQALWGMQLHTTSGTIRTVEIRRDSQSGAYQEHLIALDGGTTHYSVEVNSFTPTLSQDALNAGEHVTLWYTQVPLFDPDVLAIQIDTADGSATKYVTQAYSDPAGTRTGNLVTAGAFVLLGLLALVAAIWLPATGEAGKRGASPASARGATTKPSFGEMVVGPSRRPPDTGDR